MSYNAMFAFTMGPPSSKQNQAIISFVLDIEVLGKMIARAMGMGEVT